MAGELENLRAMCGVLKEPPDYVHGVVGGLNLLPDSIQLLHRYLPCQRMTLPAVSAAGPWP